MQDPASYNLDQVMNQIKSAKGGRTDRCRKRHSDVRLRAYPMGVRNRSVR